MSLVALNYLVRTLVLHILPPVDQIAVIPVTLTAIVIEVLPVHVNSLVNDDLHIEIPLVNQKSSTIPTEK